MIRPMSLSARHEMLLSIQEKYEEGSRNFKGQLLDAFVAATGYDRKHAIKLLKGKKSKKIKSPKKPGKPKEYTEDVVQALKMIWHASNRICSKRLVPFLPEFVSSLERYGHLSISEEIRKLILSVSPATFDRLLKKERLKVNRGLSTTRSGALLKKQIKIRTFADWNENQPGFFEADLVAHCGGTVTGVFLNTLTMTDIVTTWTECIPLLRKSADDVILGVSTAGKLLPFKILGFDVDNGCEFINYDLLDYCKGQNITFTRARRYRKNDQAHVEEKNGSIVRRLIGYDRYEGEEAWQVMSQLYAIVRLYINFFQPSLKLESKIRQGSKTVKKYEKAKTPFQRVILNEYTTQETKEKLTEQYRKLDPLSLQKEMQALQNKLWKLAWDGPIIPAAELKKDLDNELLVLENTPYRKTMKQRKQVTDRYWRSRKDPFEDVQGFIDFEMESNKNVSAIDILTKLMGKYPDKFTNGQLRTLQRRVKEIRDKQDMREKCYQKLMVDKKDMTTESLISTVIE